MTAGARAAIADPRNEVYVSAVTVDAKGFTHLPLTCHQAEQSATLPQHHRDPFDRFLVAQAQVDGMILVTRDRNIPKYGVRTLPA